MNTIISITLVMITLAAVLWLNHKIEKEKKRSRILQAFVAGIIRSISDYRSTTDRFHDVKVPQNATRFPLQYSTVMECIDWEFSKDFLLEYYEEWLKHDRNLFFEDGKYVGDGFNFIYLDFFDRKVREWDSEVDKQTS